MVANPGQEDLYLDGVGDTCDDNIDDDVVFNDSDLCSCTPLTMVVDSSGCSIEQLNLCERPRGTVTSWQNHDKYVSSVVKSVNSFLE